MNKKLLALAIAGAMAAPLAANADVTIYGTMHMGMSSVDSGTTGATSNSDGMSIHSNSSNIGFKGTEDLGNGMKTVWQIETAIGADGEDDQTATGNNWATRNTFLGLSGDFGTTVLGGNMFVPYGAFGRKFDAFNGTFGDTRAIIGSAGQGAAAGTGGNVYDARADSALVYISPNMSGFQVVAAYTVDLNTGTDPDDNDNDATSVMATYQSGSMLLGGAWQELESNGASPDSYGIRLGAQMGMGGTTVGVLWETMDGGGVGAAQAGTSVASASRLDRDAWNFYIKQAFGANTIKVQYSTVDESTDAASDGADMWSLGLDHAMSKRTTAYIAYTQLENEDGSTRDMGVANTVVSDNVQGVVTGAAPTTSNDPHALTIGMIHKF